MCVAGDIRVFVEHSLKPILEFKDTSPLQIKYFGFSSLGQSLARFFYDCHEDNVYTKSQLQSNCQLINAANNEHSQFQQIENISQTRSNQYPIEIPLYIGATSDAHILIGAQNSNVNQKGYEIGKWQWETIDRRYTKKAQKSLFSRDFVEFFFRCFIRCR